MTDVRDPGPEAVDAILREMEDMILRPTEVARSARRLRAHIEVLRSEIIDLNSGRLYAPDIDAMAGQPVDALKCVTGAKRRFDSTGPK